MAVRARDPRGFRAAPDRRVARKTRPFSRVRLFRLDGASHEKRLDSRRANDRTGGAGRWSCTAPRIRDARGL